MMKPIPEGAALLAIDVAKRRNEVLLEVPDVRRRRRMTVLNTRPEHDRLIADLEALGRPVVAGFEATGNYHRPLAWRLIEAGIELRLISSVALARTREALHNSWDKNDPKDAQVILHMLQIGACQTYNNPTAAGLNDVQELSKTHEIVSKAKTELMHRLQTHYLPLYFPEVERFYNGSRSDWFFAFLERFPTPASITALSKEAFIDAAWEVVGKKVSKARLIGDIYETAKESIGIPADLGSEAVAMFRMALSEARHLIARRAEIETAAEKRLAADPDYHRLRQLPGIGPIHALTIIAEAGDLRRFRHHRQFLKFCGLDLALGGRLLKAQEPLVLGQKPVALPDASDPAGRDLDALEAQLLLDPRAAVAGMIHRVVEDGLLDLSRNAVRVRPLRARKPVDEAVRPIGLEVAPDLVKLLARIADQLAGAANVRKLPGEVEQGQLPSCYFLLRGHVVLRIGWVEAANSSLTSFGRGMARPAGRAATLTAARPPTVQICKVITISGH